MDHSEDAKVFVLVHKMDLIESPVQKQTVFEAKRQQLEKIAVSYEVKVDYSRTSIWDKTLYSAWSRIVTQLVPNRHLFEKELNQFVQKSEADEGNFITVYNINIFFYVILVMLFEKATYLNLCYVNRRGNEQNQDEQSRDDAAMAELLRMEELSHHMKQFKLTCNRNATSYKSVEIQNSRHSILMAEFTEYTIIMVISYNPSIRKFKILNFLIKTQKLKYISPANRNHTV